MDATQAFTKIAHQLLRNILSPWGVKINSQKLRASIRNIRQAPSLIISHQKFPLDSEWQAARDGHTSACPCVSPAVAVLLFHSPLKWRWVCLDHLNVSWPCDTLEPWHMERVASCESKPRTLEDLGSCPCTWGACSENSQGGSLASPTGDGRPRGADKDRPSWQPEPTTRLVSEAVFSHSALVKLQMTTAERGIRVRPAKDRRVQTRLLTYQVMNKWNGTYSVFLLQWIFIVVELLCNVVLVPTGQQSKSAVWYIHVYVCIPSGWHVLI